MGRVVSEETKSKVRLKLIGRKLSEETRKLMSISASQRKQSDEVKKKIAESNKGKKRSPETILNMKLAQQKRRTGEVQVSNRIDFHLFVKFIKFRMICLSVLGEIRLSSQTWHFFIAPPPPYRSLGNWGGKSS